MLKAIYIIYIFSNMERRENEKKSVDTEKKEEVSPFENPDPAADMVFVVEDKELHFCKSFLIASSPVFERLFNSDFKEKKDNRVQLPDKNYKDVDLFLQQLHPVHSWKPRVINDDTLETMLRLADEYQTEHIRLKCQHYISEKLCETQIPMLRSDRSATGFTERYSLQLHQVLFYMLMCDQYSLQEPQPKLTEEASRKSVQILEKDNSYQKLSDKAKFEVMRARSLCLETEFGVTKPTRGFRFEIN